MLLITIDFEDVVFCSTYQQLIRVADEIISGRPDVYVMDAAYNDLCNYPSSIGKLYPGQPMDALLEAGYDPYGYMVGRLREAGITVLAGYRVNDHHGHLMYWTDWEREHKTWSLGKDTGAWKTFKVVGDRGWREIGDLRQMDYAIEGVRQRRLAILSEIVARYPVDGLQLDFGRTAPFLSEPKREKAGFLTQFVRDVRAMLDEAGRQRGQRLVLSAAVPWDIAFCEQEGLDIRQWIDEGLLSYVCPGEWVFVDYNMPFSKWMALTEGSGCKVYPMTMVDLSPATAVAEGKRIWLGDDYQSFDPPKIRALAENAYSQGAEGIMFYNLFVRVFGSPYYPFLRDWINPANIPSMTRHYYYARRLKYLPTEYYSFGLPDGYAPGEVEAFTPFALDKVGDQFEYHFLFGSELGTSTAAFQFKLRDLGDADKVAVSLNGQGIAPDDVLFRPCQPPDAAAFRFAVWQAALGAPPLRQGENVVHVKLVKRDPGRHLQVQAGEFEILVNPIGKP